MIRITKPLLLVSLGSILFLVAFGAYWQLGSSESRCNSCHEIGPAQDLWAQSAHRNTRCSDCHGSSFSNGFHSMRQNLRRLATHFTGAVGESIRLGEDQVVEMLPRCRRCHEREYAGWLSSGHSASYADIFLNDAHNETEKLNDDCLRCHGMYFSGSIRDIVAPISTKGPWKLLNLALKDRPVIPCLACHQIHLKGSPAAEPDHSNPKAISYRQRFQLLKPGIYDRREKLFIDVTRLPEPKIREGDKALILSPDARQRLCYQCHAPSALHQAGSSDDRTPRGIHLGLSCLSCHSPHSMEARRSCAECHPRLSNCGLEVEKMDTSYAKPESKHNIHSAACVDCHVKGVPPRRNGRG